MKKITKWISISLLVFMLGVGINVVVSNHEKPMKSGASVPVYKGIDDLTDKSPVIIKATISKEHKEEKDKFPNEKDANILSYVYKVKVDEVLKDVTDYKIKENQTIEVVQQVGITQHDKLVVAFEDGPQAFEEGTYLFYLTYFDSKFHGRKVFVPSSIMHVYKYNDEKSEFEAIKKGTELQTIDYEEAVEAAKK